MDNLTVLIVFLSILAFGACFYLLHYAMVTLNHWLMQRQRQRMQQNKRRRLYWTAGDRSRQLPLPRTTRPYQTRQRYPRP